MELLFVFVISFCLGAIVRYSLPGRLSYGLLLLPAVSAAVTSTVWVALLWLGFGFDGGWIWFLSLTAGVAAALAAALLLPQRRARSSAKMLALLSRG